MVSFGLFIIAPFTFFGATKAGFMDYADEVENKEDRSSLDMRNRHSTQQDLDTTERPLVKNFDSPEVLESDYRAFQTAHGATELFNKDTGNTPLVTEKTHAELTAVSDRIEDLVHYDEKTDPDFPRRAPSARSLYNFPSGQNANKPFDYAFQIGLRRPTYTYQDVLSRVPYAQQTKYYTFLTVPGIRYYFQYPQVWSYYPYSSYPYYGSNYYYSQNYSYQPKYKQEIIFTDFKKN